MSVCAQTHFTEILIAIFKSVCLLLTLVEVKDSVISCYNDLEMFSFMMFIFTKLHTNMCIVS